MSTASGYSRLPYGVGKLLEDAISRTRRLRLWGGLAIAGVVALLGIAAVMIVDSRFVIFDDRLRLAMTLGVALATALSALFAVILPLHRRIDLVRMARRIDALHPEFEERISTLVELAGSDPHKVGFSASLYALVGDLAEGDVGKVNFARDIPARATKWKSGAFLAFLILLVGGIVVSPDLVGRLFLRAVAPWMDIGNLFAKDITVKPGDIVILSGQVIRIEATSAKQDPLSIRLSRRTRHGWSDETTEALNDGVYETTADINEREWRYRVTAGPAVTRYYYVRVSQMPRYDLFTATVDYPSYTRLQPLVVSNAEVGAIKAIQGSRVTFDVAISDPGTVCDFRISDQPVFEYEMVSNRTGKWSLDLVNADGFRAEKGRGILSSFVDQPPSVVIERPTGTLRLPPHAKIPVEITASDDVGVTSVYFRVSIDGEPWQRHFGTRMQDPAGKPFYRTVADVDLSLYDLIFARQISFDVVTEDACPPEFGGPHAVTSTPFTVQFNANESSYAMQRLDQEVKDARRDIEEARRRLNDAKNLAGQVRDELNRNQEVRESTEQKSERLAHEISEAEKRIDELRNEFMDDERFANLTRPMERILDEMIKPALEQVENAQFRERQERAQEMNEAMPEMEKAFDALDDLSKQLTERAEKVDAFEKAKDLAARQEALARAAKEILAENPTDTAKLEAWKQLEEAAFRKADDFARSRPDSEFSEAKRKMEKAIHEMSELRTQIDAAKTAAEREQRESAAREQREKNETARIAQELSAAAADQKRAAEELARKNLPTAAQFERSAEDHMKRAEALPAVKALQKLATDAVRKASEAKDQPEVAARADEALKEATSALQQERDLREAIAKGEKTADELKKLDESLRKDLVGKTPAKAKPDDKQAAKEAARNKDLTAAEAEQAKAGESLQAAAEKRQEERLQRLAGKPDAASALSKEASEFERRATEAQKKALEALKRGEATEGTRALQKLANDTAESARKSPRNVETASAAREDQSAATDALKRERALREAMAKGERTDADLEALDREFRQLAAEKKVERAAKAAADAQRQRERDSNASRQMQELASAAREQGNVENSLKQAAQKRAEERQLRAANNENAANARAKEAERAEAQAAETLRTIGDRLERAPALPAVRALQQLATDAARNARKAPQTAEKFQAAQAAQKAATAALKREKDIREGMRRGDRTEDDLAALQNELSTDLEKAAAERTAAARKAADAALEEARKAIGEKEGEEMGRLADAALASRQDAVEAELAESQLKGDMERADALDDEESALDATRRADVEASAREARIRAMQKSALESLERNDRYRAMNLQKDIARAQARAADATEKSGEAAEARAAANAAQEAAREAIEAANRKWNDESKAKAIAAQKAAMESEAAAVEEARAERALGKIAAVEALAADEKAESASERTEKEAASPAPATSAREAADAMNREVKAQAAALGMSRQRNSEVPSEEGEKGSPDDEEKGGGGGVSDEVKALASELKRRDNPDFFRSLFTRQGWFKIRGISKDGLGAGELKDVPPEYRDLVRRYFLKLSEEKADR